MPEEKAGHKSEGKRRRTATKGRYSHHTCWHGDAWQGLMGMPPDQVGVYWRIILLMYIRRAAISDSDVEMAQFCHTHLRSYRRIKAALIERGRIVLDTENGILYDERAIREMVDSGFFSADQTERAMKRREAAKVAQSCRNIGSYLTETSVNIDTASSSNQDVSAQFGHANQYPIPKDSSSDTELAAASAAAPTDEARPPSPSSGGGRAPKRRAKASPPQPASEDPDARKAAHEAFLREQRERLGMSDEAAA